MTAAGAPGQAPQPDRSTDEEFAASVHERVTGLLREARAEAEQVRAQVEQQALARATELRAGAQQDAARIRGEAQQEAEGLLVEAQSRIDAFARQRMQTLMVLTQELAGSAQELQQHLEDTTGAKSRLDQLVDDLGQAAASIAVVMAADVAIDDGLSDTRSREDRQPVLTVVPEPEANAGRPAHRRTAITGRCVVTRTLCAPGYGTRPDDDRAAEASPTD